MPPVGLQARKACSGSDQGIDGIKIALQIVELTAYRSFNFATARLLLLGHIEEVGTCLSAVIAGTVLTQICSLATEIFDHSLGRLPRLIQKFEISRIRNIDWCAGSIDGERSPVLVFWPISRLHKIVKRELAA